MAWTTSLPTRATTYDVTATDWNNVIGNLNFLAEVAYAEFTSDVSATASTVGTANQIVALGSTTYLNAPHLIEFWCGRANVGAGTANVILRDGTTVLGTLTQLTPSQNQSSIYLARRLTPSAGSHNYNVACWVSAAITTTFKAGTGGAAGDGTTNLPGYIRAIPIPT